MNLIKNKQKTTPLKKALFTKTILHFFCEQSLKTLHCFNFENSEIIKKSDCFFFTSKFFRAGETPCKKVSLFFFCFVFFCETKQR